ncbi:E3 ubiquitin-protein ligase [Cryptosporidium ubiquitum]|uniref:HECT-type E3 ubiquitin transferase n=1 Tax=Cryptosporidium ubiquitum TaxID=857276 RepID=A0A1J4MFX8_9CRYT|nr:E3 ubiquitin-protein ligase [Cryptosporidium ubiquitum]OII73142.1 E3 ubiquitin-protein ligase [Cryptosporidium ubiquitum]
MELCDDSSVLFRLLFERCFQEYLLLCCDPTESAANAINLANELTRKCTNKDEKQLLKFNLEGLYMMIEKYNLCERILGSYKRLKNIRNCINDLKQINYSYEQSKRVLEYHNKSLIDVVGIYSDYYILNKLFLIEEGDDNEIKIDIAHLKMFTNWIELMSRETSELPIVKNTINNEPISSIISLAQLNVIEMIKNNFNVTTEINQHLDEKIGAKIIRPCQVRFVLVLFQGNILEHGFGGFSALRSALNLIYLFPSNIQEVIKSWFIKLPLEYLEQAVSTLQQMISVRFYELYDDHNENFDITRFPFRNIASNAIKSLKPAFLNDLRISSNLLRILFDANKERGIITIDFDFSNNNRLDISLFTNEAINSARALLQYELRQWFLSNPPSNDTEFGLLKNAYLLEPSIKAQALQQDSLMQQRLELQSSISQALGSVESLFNPTQALIQPFLVLKVHRDSIVNDSMEQLVIQSNLKKQLKVSFVGEEGVDEGGVQKEFFQLLVQEIFNIDFGMFIYYEDTRLFWFNMASLESNGEFELIGIVLALAIYNGIILDVHFPLAVYKKLLGYKVDIGDLYEIQPEVANSLLSILSIKSESEMEQLCLTFSATINNFGVMTEVPIAPGEFDPSEPVTISNVQRYVEIYLDWFLNKSIESQFRAFYNGFQSVCGGRTLELFSPEELVLVICGSSDFNIDSLIEASQYQDGYTKDSTTVVMFWEIVKKLDLKLQKKLLFFVTGSDRVPMKGLGELGFVIGRHGPDSDLLPIAHTCFNFLLIPDYQNKEKLERLLLIALEHSKGFGLK